jgi:tRNA-specific 2-thiouridylase
VIYITLNKSFLEAEKTRFAISHLNWIGEGQPESGRYSVKIRHGAKRIECRLQLQDPYSGIVELESGDKGIAPGQFAVFYKGEQCLGGAVITN